MSFRHATDATYIAQLLGRMIRTPMQMHIQVDDTLNDVHLYLPYFNADTVNDVVKELQNAEGGELPTDIYGESLESRVMETLTVRPRTTTTTPQQLEHNIPGQMSLFDNPTGGETTSANVVKEKSIPYITGISTATQSTSQEETQAANTNSQ